MTERRKKNRKPVVVAAVSGGPDSMYLLGKLSSDKRIRVVVGHVNYRSRGMDSAKDQALVEVICERFQYEKYIHALDNAKFQFDKKVHGGKIPAGFEKMARDIRYRFLKDISEGVGADAIALAHTADDQIETILMRVFEGAGIGGLKGIPRETRDGIVRPILDIWKDEILVDLKKRKIPYRIDRSNLDTRFERNWLRHVLIPILEKRYGKAVKKRIFTLGERFRELDDYLEGEAGRWIRKNLKNQGNDAFAFRRKSFSTLPSALRVKILQRICFDRLGTAPNERLLTAMDGIVSVGGPSARVNAGNGWSLANRYEESLFQPAGRKRGNIGIVMEAKEKFTPAQAKRLAAKGDGEVFDAAGLGLPLTVRPLRAGDRIRPFGDGGNERDGGKKVKEILIDRKIAREDRWGRLVVCDSEGTILWIPGVVRSALAPVTPATRKVAILRIRSMK